MLSNEEPPVYRYSLDRSWDVARPVMVWIMLNPSTADHEIDDPTVQACMDFARRNDCGGITVVNLFGFRSPSPQVMHAAKDPVGPKNDTFLKRVLVKGAQQGDLVGGHQGRDKEVRRMIKEWGVKLMCIGRTKDGHPKHPLARGVHRVARDAPLLSYEWEP